MFDSHHQLYQRLSLWFPSRPVSCKTNFLHQLHPDELQPASPSLATLSARKSSMQQNAVPSSSLYLRCLILLQVRVLFPDALIVSLPTDFKGSLYLTCLLVITPPKLTSLTSQEQWHDSTVNEQDVGNHTLKKARMNSLDTSGHDWAGQHMGVLHKGLAW